MPAEEIGNGRELRSSRPFFCTSRCFFCQTMGNGFLFAVDQFFVRGAVERFLAFRKIFFEFMVGPQAVHGNLGGSG